MNDPPIISHADKIGSTPNSIETYSGVSKFDYKIPRRNDVPDKGDTDDINASPSRAIDLIKDAAKMAGKSSTPTDSGSNVYDVIIIGAGWAGMTAALNLQKRGITNFKVLEGRDYIGGRTQTKKVDGMIINTGSMWLMENACNPLMGVARDAGSRLVNYYSNYQMWYNGTIMSDQDFARYAEALYTYGWSSYTYHKMYLADKDEPLQNATNEVLATIDKYSNPSVKKLILKTLLEGWFSIPYGMDFKRLSLFYGEDGSYICNGGAWSFVSSSFSKIINTYVKPVRPKIQTEAAVKKIEYKDYGNTTITYEDRSGETVIEKTLFAKKVIVTVPLGVLKNRGIQFNPALPKQFMNGVRGIGMGRQVRAFMFWDKGDIFWPQNADHLMNSNMTGSGIVYHIPSSLHNDTIPQLIAVMTSPEAFRLERNFALKSKKIYHSALAKLAMEPLRNMFGEKIPDPKRTYGTNWNVDEFSYGIYTSNKVNHLPSYRTRLKKPIDDTLFFAGEATSSRYYGTIHGAYYTGNGVALKVYNSLNK